MIPYLLIALIIIIIVLGGILVTMKITSNTNAIKEKPTQNKRKEIKDIQPNEMIKIEYWKISGDHIGSVKCINNDPLTKKILVEVKWKNYIEANSDEFEKFILEYKSDELKNFNLLNDIQHNPKIILDETRITDLLKEKFKAIENEEYEKADTLQKHIDNLIKK